MADDYGAPTSEQEAQSEDKKKVARYWREIERYNRATDMWRQDAENIVDLYLQQDRERQTTRKFPLLWANVETLKPAVYAKLPIAQCSRRYKDKDPTGRIAAEVLERCANTSFDLYRLDEVLRMVRDDRLLSGRGTAWVRYEADFKTEKDDSGEEYEKLAGEKVCVDYVHWQDFGHSLARTWADVRMVWRRVYKTKDEVEERFGKEIAGMLSYTAKAPDEKDETGLYRACIYEIWDKKRGKVIWLAKEAPKILEVSDPPSNFMGFFPCPEPCYATKTSKSLIPTPDYIYYRDQAKEINDLTDQIDKLTDWLMLRGFVPSGPDSEGGNAVQKLVANVMNTDALLVEVESWAAFQEKGGATKIIDWLPIDKVIVALKGAMEARAQIIQDVFQLTGISDILRGQTDPNETLGAQELKAQTGSRRLKNTRDEIVRFCKDITRLVCEVIAEQFQPETLAAMSGFQYMPAPPPDAIMPGPMPGMQPPMPQAAPQGAVSMMGQAEGMNAPEQAGVFDDRVIQLLRDDRMRGFRIDIETDSTIQPDEDAEKQRRVEFLTAVGQFVNQTREVATVMPALMPVLGKSLLFLVRGFRAGRELEDDIERAIAGMQQQIQQQMNQPKQDPEMVKAQAQVEITKAKTAAEIEASKAKTAAEIENTKAKTAAEIEIAHTKAAAEQKIMGVKAAQEIAVKHRAAETDRELMKNKAADERVQKQLSHAADMKAKEEAASKKAENASPAVKLSVPDSVANAVGATITESLKDAGKEMAASIKEALSNITLKTAPRVRRPKYDRAGNIVEVREEDEQQGTMQ